MTIHDETWYSKLIFARTNCDSTMVNQRVTEDSSNAGGFTETAAVTGGVLPGAGVALEVRELGNDFTVASGSVILSLDVPVHL